MSQNQNPTPVKAVPASSEAATETSEKLSYFQKSKQFVKNHKKSTIAVGALVGLVGLASMTGKKQPLPAFEATLALEPPHASLDVETVQDDDTVTA